MSSSPITHWRLKFPLKCLSAVFEWLLFPKYASYIGIWIFRNFFLTLGQTYIAPNYGLAVRYAFFDINVCPTVMLFARFLFLPPLVKGSFTISEVLLLSFSLWVQFLSRAPPGTELLCRREWDETSKILPVLFYAVILSFGVCRIFSASLLYSRAFPELFSLLSHFYIFLLLLWGR